MSFGSDFARYCGRSPVIWFSLPTHFVDRPLNAMGSDVVGLMTIESGDRNDSVPTPPSLGRHPSSAAPAICPNSSLIGFVVVVVPPSSSVVVDVCRRRWSWVVVGRRRRRCRRRRRRCFFGRRRSLSSSFVVRDKLDDARNGSRRNRLGDEIGNLLVLGEGVTLHAGFRWWPPYMLHL